MTNSLPTDPDAPYALGDPSEIARRLKIIDLPHVRPLKRLRQRMMESMGRRIEIPHFDPCDAGVEAELLVLLEAPGPKAVGSAFISRNNPDPTARNLNNLLREAGISRTRTLLWNAVPWYIGSETRIRAARSGDLESAQPWTRDLIMLLPRLRVVVLSGRKAQRIDSFLRGIVSCPVLHSYHPSNLSLNRDASRRSEVLSVLREAAESLAIEG